MKLHRVSVMAVLILFVVSGGTFAEKYEPTWESLDKRPIPKWFSDAKFGIFIHWGVYSVPAWSPRGTYTEWYQHWEQGKGMFGNTEAGPDAVHRFHKKLYGDRTYYDFAKDFRAELWEPREWADLFERAGAKYVVLTSKHHDGFALWPSKEANDRGFVWNSLAIGPKRDLVGELSKAVKDSSLKMGLYYSLFEWYHPEWHNEAKRATYVDNHMLPQLRELVEKYQPDILWPDGQWSLSSDQFKTKEFLAWVYNESPVKQSIVTNDRWGKETRFKHGGYLTPEYESGAKFDKPWEECRGMGASFGYNRDENAEDYNTPQTLVLMLADIVSNGGNLLLNIGPRADGKIDPIMQHHLLEMGKWLDRNGEAIYGSRKWSTAIQWSGGNREYKPYFKKLFKRYTGGNYITIQTLNPPEGYATKEAFFTKKNGALYVILPKWHPTFTVKGLVLSDEAQASLLCNGAEVQWKNTTDGVKLNLSEYIPNQFKLEDAYAYVIKLSDASIK